MDQRPDVTCLSLVSLLPHIAVLNEDLSGLNRIHSSYSASYAALWSSFFEWDIRTIEGVRCIFAIQDGLCFMYWPPLMRNPSESLLSSCFAYMDERNGSASALSRIEHVSKEQADDYAQKGYKVVNKGYDYCYYKQCLTELNGARYKRYRHAIHKMHTLGKLNFRPYEQRDQEACRKILAGWLEQRRGAYAHEAHHMLLDDAEKLHAFVLRCADDLSCVIRVLCIDGDIRGYTFGYPISRDVFCVAGEIADLSLPGVSAVMFQALCSDAALESYRFINAMDDAGLEHLYKHKMRYGPVLREPVYTVSR